jgi:hypothetical protein
MEVQVDRKPDLTGAVALAHEGPHDISSSIEQKYSGWVPLKHHDPAIRQSPRGGDLMQWTLLVAEDDEGVGFDAPGVDGELGGTRGHDSSAGGVGCDRDRRFGCGGFGI